MQIEAFGQPVADHAGRRDDHRPGCRTEAWTSCCEASNLRIRVIHSPRARARGSSIYIRMVRRILLPA